MSPSLKQLLPLEAFQLYAICTRRPQGLEIKWKAKWLQKGIYEIGSFTRPIRIILLSQIGPHPRNALWHLFSANESGFGFGDQHYHWRGSKAKRLLNDLYELYCQEEVVMSYTLEDYYREHVDPYIESLSLEIRLKGLPPEERLKGLPVEERLKGLPAEVLEEYLAKLKSTQSH